MAQKKRPQDVRKYERLLEKQTGRAIRPYRADGFVNLLNKYGTQKDTTEHYHFQPDPMIPDDMLTAYYEGNGLFAKVIDAPAEEAIKHGFTLDLNDQTIEDFYTGALDELDWEETAMTALKWTRLFGGCIVVMLINDGRGLDEPLDWKSIKSIDDLRVFDRSLIQEDTSSMFDYRADDPFRIRSSRLGMPEYYDVYSKYGSFRVHDSRCLVFQNGVLPENTSNSIYQLWGIPEYLRINKAIRDSEVAHGSAVKLLDRSVQAVYKMKGLSSELSTDGGETAILRRLQTIDMARGLLNSITIDADGEDYDFRTFSFTGVSDVVDSTCNYLSALTNIPQTVLFGRSPAGMNSTGDADLENWYSYIERIQSRVVKKNLRYLLSVIFQAGVACGEIDEVPDIKIEFNPLWSMSESEKAAIDQQRASIQQTKAQTAQIYMDAQVIDPSEVRRKLADSDEFDIDTLLDEYDEDDLFANMPQGEEQEEGAEQTAGDTPESAGDTNVAHNETQFIERVSQEEHNTDPGTEGSAPTAAPAATKLPEDMSEEEKETALKHDGGPGSGHWGHAGNPGHVGGSAPTGENAANPTVGSHKAASPKEAVSKICDTAKKAAASGKTFKESKAQIFVDTGNTGLPKSVSEDDFNNAKSDYPTLYRGFEGYEQAEQFCNGDAYIGSGFAGAGTNASGNPEDANEWGGENVLEMKLAKGAKVISEADFMPIYKQVQSEFSTELTGKGKEIAEVISRNAGCVAAALGYDAIYSEDRNWFNIINRSQVIVKRVGNTDSRQNRYRAFSNPSKPPKQDARADGNTPTTPKLKNGSVAVLVALNGCFLTGTRKSEFGNGLVCGPGGHVEDGESHEEAAIREAQEEFGITPKDMILLGYGPWEPDTGLKPAIYLATEYDGEIQNADGEIEDIHFRTMAELAEMDKALFQPFKDALEMTIEIVAPSSPDMGTGHSDVLMSPDEFASAISDKIAKYGYKGNKSLDKNGKSGIIKSPKQHGQKWQIDPEDAAFLLYEFGLDVGTATDNEIMSVVSLMREDDEYAPLPEGARFITANGTSFPIDEEGNAIAGPLEGQSFSEATSEPSGTAATAGKSFEDAHSENTSKPTGMSGEAEAANASPNSTTDARKELEEKIANGSIKTKLNRIRQEKHIEGTEEYRKATEGKGENPSIVTLSKTEIRALIQKAVKDGDVTKLKGGEFWISYTYEKEVGIFKSADGSISVPTKNVTVRLSKTGAHIVPDEP